MPSRRRLASESWIRLGEFLPDVHRPLWVVTVGAAVALSFDSLLLLGWIASKRLPYGAVLAQGSFVLWAAVWFYEGFWRRRGSYRQRYGAMAYRQLCLRFLLPALPGGLAAIYFPALVGGERCLPSPLAYGIAAYLLLTLVLIEARGTDIFWSWDVRSFAYSVFPERADLQTSGIFRWLRHPVYSTAMRWVFLLALARNNSQALSCAAVLALAMWLLARLEERDLLQRNPAYAEYRRRVPAFLVKRPVQFWHFLLTGRDG